MGEIVQASDTSFEKDVLKADRPVVVDFWAEWCGPCKMIAPYIDELAAEFGDRVRFVKVNIDENPLTPTRYGVRGIPTLMLFKNGELRATKVGALPKSKLREWIEENLGESV
ncbi:Thioredoxin [bacterium HR40]|nr:Thioredoxin [bacterium HR40]